MSYTPPNLSFDIVLPQQIGDQPALDVVLCAPSVDNVLATIDGAIAVGGGIDLDVKTGESQSYTPPPLSTEIVLTEDVFGASSQIRDVILCRPQSEIDRDVFVGIDGAVTVDSDIELSADIPEPRYVTLDSAIVVQPELSLDAGEFVVGIDIDTYADINVQSEINAHYDSNVFRGAMHDVRSDVQQSKLATESGSDSFESSKINGIKTDAAIQTSKLTATKNTVLFEANVKLDTSKQFKAEQSKLIGAGSESLSESLRYIADKTTLKNEASRLVGDSDWLSFEAMAYRQIERIIKADYGQLIGDRLDTASEYNVLVGQNLTSLAESARLPFSITRYIPPPLWQTVILKEQEGAAPPLDVTLCKPLDYVRVSSNLTIDALANLTPSAALSLSVGDAGSAYGSGVIFVTNSVSLTRTDDGRSINLFDFSVGIDSNSYCWTFSASVPLAELSKVNTASEARIGVDLTVNGHLWRFVLDGCDDTIAFGERSLSIKGKSRAMLLANPYAAHRGHKFDVPLSARQIAEAELNRGGIPSGFTLDWDLVGVNGWNVPANTYSYSNRTPINSLQWIAEAAGGFINSDMSADIIHVKELYKIPSWEWSTQTPLLTLPQSLILNRSQNRINKPAYNGVQVWGEREGSVGALIKRTGTAGSYAPPMVTSDLITTNDVARSRGIAILSDTGDMADVSITMPLHSDFGILKPSTLIGVNDGEQWVGMVRGTSIKGKLSSQQTLEIEQSLSIERHFEGA